MAGCHRRGSGRGGRHGCAAPPDGEDALRAVGDHVWTWLLAQLRDSRPDGLSKQDEEQARRIASELTLFDYPGRLAPRGAAVGPLTPSAP